jgi:hypothetical protein
MAIPIQRRLCTSHLSMSMSPESHSHQIPHAAPRPASRGRAAILVLCLAVLAAGCSSSGIQTTHGYVLVRTQDAALVPVPDDDPLYTVFDTQVLQDAYLRNLLDLFEHTTDAFVATNTASPLRQTVHNYPILVLDSAGPGVLRDIVLQSSGGKVPVERALGLGDDGAMDLYRAREAFASASTLWVLELVGVSTTGAGSEIALDQPADAQVALCAGLAAAVDALHALAASPGPAASYAGVGAAAAPLQARRQAIVDNAYAYRWAHGHATAQRLPRAEAVRTPGATGTFFCRLLQQTGVYTRQRDMLWFVNYTGPEMPLAKTLRVCRRLAGARALDMESFVAVYAETYPAERDAVLALADEVYGPQEVGGGHNP